MKDIEINVSMRCSVCGNDQFSSLDKNIDDIANAYEEIEVKCSDCGKVTTKKQLIDDNSYIIDANLKDFKQDIIKQLQKDFSKMFE